MAEEVRDLMAALRASLEKARPPLRYHVTAPAPVLVRGWRCLTCDDVIPAETEREHLDRTAYRPEAPRG